MRGLIAWFNNLTWQFRMIAALVTAGSLTGLFWLCSRIDPRYAVFVVVALLLVLLSLGLYVGFLKWQQKRKAARFSKEIGAESAAAPAAISAAERRARLDDLRRQFEEGTKTFRAHGKDLYSLPWYVIVGEPGSGKTEALRHGDIGCPPGLNDEFQGVGGTINMNWWFTNRAIILDTAGRIMFEEVDPGTTSEWEEFLRLLRKSRPNCPINGMLLVIPADSLIRDPAEEISRKADKIARQLALIQRTLDNIRFPVFVMITKSDLINGFREFFEDVNDVKLQSQMLGWSNPASLDDPFDANCADTCLTEIRKRLSRRRLALLLDPVNRTPTAARLNDVDAMFAFPESLTRIAPSLRAYLEKVFAAAAGVWSSKPVFLRGIYFTSAMREGDALDAALADALGVAIDSVRDTREWDQEKAYFLRDVLNEKVFREQGLVTWATSARRQHRQRKGLLLGSALAGVLLLLGMTWYSARLLEASIGKQGSHWTAAANAGWQQDDGDSRWRPVLVPVAAGSTRYRYDPHPPQRVRGDEMGTAAWLASLEELAEQRMHVPWVFKPVAVLSSTDFTAARRDAENVLFDTAVLRPLLTAVGNALADPGRKWDADASAALEQLLRLEARIHRPDTPRASDRPLLATDPLCRFVLAAGGDASELDKYLSDPGRDIYQALMDKFYGEAEGRGWPPKWLLGDDGQSQLTPIVNAALDRFVAYWSVARIEADGRVAGVRQLLAAMQEYDRAEQELLALRGQANEGANAAALLVAWRQRLDALLKQQQEITAGALVQPGKTLTQLYEEAVAGVLKEAKPAFETLTRHVPARPQAAEEDAGSAPPQDALDGYRIRLEAAWQKLEEQLQKSLPTASLATLDQRLFGTGGEQRLFALRGRMYQAADDFLVSDQGADLEKRKLVEALKLYQEELQAFRVTHRQIIDLAATQPGAARVMDARATTITVMTKVLAERTRAATARAGMALPDYTRELADASAATGLLVQVSTALERFGDAEQSLLNLSAESAAPETAQEAKLFSEEWRRRYAALTGAGDQAAKLLSQGAVTDFARSYRESTAALLDQAAQPVRTAQAALSTLRDEVTANEGFAKAIARDDAELKKLMGDLEASLAQRIPAADLQQIDQTFLARAKDGRPWYQFRLQLYQEADAQLQAGPEAPDADLFRLGRQLDAETERIQELRARHKRYLETTPDAPRLAPAVKVAALVADTAERVGRARLLGALLEAFPRTPDAAAAVVAARAQALDARLSRPSIPFTLVEGGEFKAEYNPEAATELFSIWRNAMTRINDAASPLLDRAELETRARRVERVRDGYLDAYLDYWLRNVPRELEVTAQPWATRQPQLTRVRVWEIHDAFEDVLRSLRRALDAVKGDLGEEHQALLRSADRQIAESTKRIQSTAFRNECQEILYAWSALPAAPPAARERLLQHASTDLVRKYLVTTARGGPPDYVLGYWQSLTYQLIRALADEIESAMREDVNRLRAALRFPLTRPPAAVTEEPLEPTGLDRLRELVAALSPGDNKGGGTNVELVGSDARLAEQLQRLSGPARPEDRVQITRIRQLLAALPPPQRQYRCTVSVLPDSKQQALSSGETVLGYWNTVRLCQGDTTIKEVRTTQLEATPVGDISYPGDVIRFEFRRHPSQTTPDRVVSVPGQWAALRLLHPGQPANAEGAVTWQWRSGLRSDDGRQWQLELQLPDANGTGRSLWLQLEFEKSLPALSDWP